MNLLTGASLLALAKSIYYYSINECQETLYSGVTNGREIELSCNSAHVQAQGYLIALFARLKGRRIALCL